MLSFFRTGSIRQLRGGGCIDEVYKPGVGRVVGLMTSVSAMSLVFGVNGSRCVHLKAGLLVVIDSRGRVRVRLRFLASDEFESRSQVFNVISFLPCSQFPHDEGRCW